VKEINQLGMDTNIATFQRECPPHEEFDRSHLNECRLVAVDGDTAIGWRTPS
jgi:phosphinothricin acetyltransferase